MNQGLVNIAARKIAQNSPAILSGLAVLGLGVTAVFASKAAIKANDIIIDSSIERHIPEDEFTFKEKVALTWRVWVPTATVIVGTGACIIFAQSINSRRNAALVGLYTLTEKAYTEYKEKTREVLGETKETSIREAIAKDQMEKNPPPSDFQKALDMAVKGDVSLCLDQFSGRWFGSNTETLRKAMNDINAECINQNYASLNDFYSKIGLGTVPIGDSLGWTSDHMLELEFVYIPDEDGRPAMAVSFKRQPKMDYYKVW